MTDSEVEFLDPDVKFCELCGSTLGFSSRSGRRPQVAEEPEVKVNPLDIRVTTGVVFQIPRCAHCGEDEFLLSETPGEAVYLELRKRFQKNEITHEQFVELEAARLAEILEVTDIDELPTSVVSEVLADQLKLTQGDKWAPTPLGRYGYRQPTIDVPITQALENWDPETGKVTLSIRLIDIVLKLDDEEPLGPNTAMWRRYWDLQHPIDVSKFINSLDWD